jgi:hypothetical protein
MSTTSRKSWGRPGALNETPPPNTFGCPVCYRNSQYSEAKPDRMGLSPSYPIYRCVVCDFHFLDPSAYPLRDVPAPRRH